MRTVNLLLILPFIFLSTVTYSQEFILTPEGFINSTNPEKDYLVIEFDSLKQEVLYKKTRLFVTDLMYDPNESLNYIENEVIKISGFQDNVVRRTKFHVFDLRYNLTFKFKDGKIRIDSPSIEMTTYTHKNQVLHIQHRGSLTGSNMGIYNMEGTLNSKMAKSDLEAFFKNIIVNLTVHVTLNEDDNW